MFALKRERGSIKMQTCADRVGLGGGGGNIFAKVPIEVFLIKYLRHKLLAIITRFFVSFTKICLD